MNIFFLDQNPGKAARYHHDRHVNKMIIESVQMMAAVHGAPAIYPASVPNHPCTRWLKQSTGNWSWLVELVICLEYEKKTRFASGTHKTLDKYWLDLYLPPSSVKDGKLTPPHLAMPDDCKISDDPVECYREYYRRYKTTTVVNGKEHKNRWSIVGKPEWL